MFIGNGACRVAMFEHTSSRDGRLPTGYWLCPSITAKTPGSMTSKNTKIYNYGFMSFHLMCCKVLCCAPSVNYIRSDIGFVMASCSRAFTGRASVATSSQEQCGT